MIDETEQAVAVLSAPPLGRWRHGDARSSLPRGRRRITGDHLVHDRTHRIDVSPRADVAVRIKLLDRGVRRRADERGRSFGRPAELHGSAEVDERRRTVRTHKNILRLYVAMEQFGSVQFGQSLAEWQHDGLDFLFGHRPILEVQDVTEACSRLVVHDEVSGAVCFEIAVHPHDVRMSELR